MQMHEIRFNGVMPVEGYGPGFFRIGGQVLSGPVLVRPQRVSPWGGLADAPPLLALAGEIDVLLIGTGAEIAPIPASLRASLEAVGLGVEMMASPPACRTYNVLLSEGRRVAVGLLPVD
jgi:uncharacterized protein